MEAGGTVLKAPALVKEVMRLGKDFGVGAAVVDGNWDWRKCGCYHFEEYMTTMTGMIIFNNSIDTRVTKWPHQNLAASQQFLYILLSYLYICILQLIFSQLSMSALHCS